MKWIEDFLVAIKFLTRLPVPRVRFDPDSLSRAAKFFPVVGLGIGLGASALQRIAAPHLSRPLVALLVLTFLVLITSGASRRRPGGYRRRFWRRVEPGAGSYDSAR